MTRHFSSKGTWTLTFLLAAALALATGGAAAAGNLITNGSFEDSPDPGTHWQTLFKGDTRLTGWEITQGSVDVMNDSFADAADGTRSIDLDGQWTGGLRQSIATTPGIVYEVTFQLSGPAGSPGDYGWQYPLKAVNVGADTYPAATSADYAFNGAGKTPTNMGWVEKVFTFTATNETTAITFTSTTTGNPCRCQGAFLDDVQAGIATLGPAFDVKPNSTDNSINTASRGVIPTAILTTDTLDASTVDVSSLRFGPGGASAAHGTGHLEDVDADGDLDLVVHFGTKASRIPDGATEACVTGTLQNGQPIHACDTIRTTRS